MKASSSPTAPPLQEQIRQLVAELRHVRKQRTRETGYRGLVRRAHQAQMPAADFQHALQFAGMKASHASELATIRAHPIAAAGFTRSVAPLSFRAALRTARGMEEPEAESPPAGVAEESERNAQKKLVRVGNQLVSLQPTGQPWSIPCGLFTLGFVPESFAALPPLAPSENRPAAETGPVPPATMESAAPAAPKLVIPLSPESADKLGKLARRSGLNKAETAGLLLERAPYAEITELVQPMAPNPSLPDLDVGFGLLRGNSGDPFELPRGKTSDALGLQRRQHPSRTPADEWRVPVAVPKTVTDAVRAIADCCGLTAAETANRLLEPAPCDSFRAIAPALRHATQRRTELVVQDNLRALPLPRPARPQEEPKC